MRIVSPQIQEYPQIQIWKKAAFYQKHKQLSKRHMVPNNQVSSSLESGAWVTYYDFSSDIKYNTKRAV